MDLEGVIDCGGSQSAEGTPLKLITFGRRNDFAKSLEVTLHKEVLDQVLATCDNRKVSIITVTGEEKAGSSMLANCIKEQLLVVEKWSENRKGLLENQCISGFIESKDWEPCTNGVWIWSRAFLLSDEDGEKIAVLLLDAQGIRNGATRNDQIRALLGISCMVSSTVILNFQGDIPNEVLSWLQKMLDHGSWQHKNGVKKPYQNMHWIIRDWTRIKEYGYGENAGNKLLSSFLKSSPQLEQSLKLLWDELSCFLMPHIGLQANLASYNGNTSHWGKDFYKRMSTFVYKTANTERLSPRKLNGNEMIPSDLSFLLTSYVNLLNDKTELDWGPPAESVWQVILETIGSNKIQKGIAAYRQEFDKRQSGVTGGYLLEPFIDSLHIRASQKAKESFDEVEFPKTEERLLRCRLEAKLIEELDLVKERNIQSRKRVLTESVGDACSDFHRQLEHIVPLKENFFYDEQNLESSIQNIVDQIQANFLAKFSEQDDVHLLQSNLESVITPVWEAYLEKNQKMKEKVTHQIESLKAEIIQKHHNLINELLSEVPDTTSKSLRFFHKKELDSINERFQNVNIGPTAYQEEQKMELLANLDRFIEQKEACLDDTMNEAKRIAKEEEIKYRQTLLETALKIEEAESIKQFHVASRKSILTNFKLNSPVRKDACRQVRVEEELQTALDQAYTEVIDDGVLKEREVTSKLKKAFQEARETFTETVQSFFLEEGFAFKDEQLNQVVKEAVDLAFECHEAKLNEILGKGSILCDSESEELTKILDREVLQWQVENSNMREAAISQAEVLILEGKKEFESKLTALSMKLKTMDEVQQASVEARSEAVMKFEASCNVKSPNFLSEYKDKLHGSLKEIIASVEDFMKTKQQTQNLGLMTAQLEATKTYNSKMTERFRSNDGNYFSDEDLATVHEEAVNFATEACKSAVPLVTHDQMSSVKESLMRIFHTYYREENEINRKSHEANTSHVVGIDLGTTYSAVGIYHRGKVHIIRSTAGTNTTPSYVTINSPEDYVCGHAAKELAVEKPNETICNVKRIIGRSMKDKKLLDDMKTWSFTVKDVGGIPKIEVEGKTYRPEEISAKLLKQLKKEAEDIMGFKIEAGIITCPAYFTDLQRKATMDAAELAGFKVLGILNEPSAAAIAYRKDCFAGETPRKILVFDLGGGTFDVVVLEMSLTEMKVLNISGDGHLGGEDFDTKLVEFCAKKFETQSGVDIFEDKDSKVQIAKDEARRNIRRLQDECERVKRRLSSALKANVSIACLHNGKDLKVQVSRKEFETMNAAKFMETIDIAEKAVVDAGLSKDDIDEIVLVGGSTRIPAVQKMLKDRFPGKSFNQRINPDEAVAYGAAIQAAMVNANPGSKLFDFTPISEVTPMSLGIKDVAGEVAVIIPKNTSYPVQHSRSFVTTGNYQDTVSICIYQGEDSIAVNNKLLGDFRLSGIPPNLAGKEEVIVKMSIDTNGILTVAATSTSTYGSNQITISDSTGRMSNEEKRRLLEQGRI